ncbi:MAG: hypothetical protein WA418_34880 [Bradyrhizobium sp.]
MSEEPQPPAPERPKVEPVTWTVLLATVKNETNRYDFRLKIFRQELVEASLSAGERENLERIIAGLERHAQVFVKVWDVLWAVRSDERLLKRFNEVRRAELRGVEQQPDHVQYD